MENLTPEMMEHKKMKLHRFLMETIVEEIEGAEDYNKYSICAKELGMNNIAMMLNKSGKEELVHANGIITEITKMIPNIEKNELYPLFLSKIEWLEDVKEDLDSFR